jgi:tetratricopeptide (TPR) repeat protein
MLLDAKFDKTNDKNDRDAALHAFDEAIGLDPDDAGAYVGRGIAYGKKGKWDREIEDLDKAIGLDPKFAVAYANRGVAYETKGELDRAIEDYT